MLFRSNGTEVSALFYAASKGDSDAQKEIDRLAKSGKEAVEEAKKERLGSIDRRNDNDREFQEKKARLEEMLSQAKQKQAGSEWPDRDKREKITPKDLILVRWSDFEPEYDEDGNAVLKPASEYMAIDRQTMHFTLNHSVEEHIFWQQNENGGHLIMIPLQDVLDANGIESLDNLYGIDTFFTPKPGQGLILPKQNLHVQHIGPDEDRKQITKDLLSKKYGTFGVAGGTHYTDTPGFDGVIDEIAAELGVTSALHANTGPYHLESENNYNTDGPVEHAIRNNADPVGYFIPSWIADFSDNAILRLADRKSGKWSGASSNTVYKNESGRRGFVSTSRRVGAPDGPMDISKGIKDVDTARTVGAVQSRVNEIVSGVDFSRRHDGFASRSDVVPLKNKSIDEIAKELRSEEHTSELQSH